MMNDRLLLIIGIVFLLMLILWDLYHTFVRGHYITGTFCLLVDISFVLLIIRRATK